MARERFIALRCPIRYHNETTGLSPWNRAVWLTWPLAVFSMMFVTPIFFEANIVEVEDVAEIAYKAAYEDDEMVRLNSSS